MNCRLQLIGENFFLSPEKAVSLVYLRKQLPISKNKDRSEKEDNSFF